MSPSERIEEAEGLFILASELLAPVDMVSPPGKCSGV